jgi:hypothetical protein
MQASGDEQQYCAGPLRPVDGEAFAFQRYACNIARLIGLKYRTCTLIVFACACFMRIYYTMIAGMCNELAV